MTRIGNLLALLSDRLAAIGRLVLLATMLHVTLDVMLRFVINQPLAGTVEKRPYRGRDRCPAPWPARTATADRRGVPGIGVVLRAAGLAHRP